MYNQTVAKEGKPNGRPRTVSSQPGYIVQRHIETGKVFISVCSKSIDNRSTDLASQLKNLNHCNNALQDLATVEGAVMTKGVPTDSYADAERVALSLAVDAYRKGLLLNSAHSPLGRKVLAQLNLTN